MFPLSEIIGTAEAGYQHYVAKKTGFLVNKNNPESLQWLWLHIIRNFDIDFLDEELNADEKAAFDNLLTRFGYISANHITEAHEQLEQKLIWVFRHPAGGIFVPLEVFKTLMQESTFLNRQYLFSLIFHLKREQQNLASFVGGSLEAQLSISFEKNQLDMALVLYIWLANQHKNADLAANLFFERGKVLSSPYAFIRESGKQDKNNVDFFPEQPVAMWPHLYNAFGHLRGQIDEWYSLMHDGNKSFYRSLNLISDQNCELVQAFRHGFYLPVLSRNYSNKNNLDNIKIVTPKELRNIVNHRGINQKASPG